MLYNLASLKIWQRGSEGDDGMNAIERLEKMWEHDRRYTTRYTLVVAGSLFIHAVLAVMFLLAERYAFMALNVGALVFYGVWAWQFTCRLVNEWMLVALYLDVVIHACIYNLALGQGPAFFLYPFIVIPVTFFFTIRDLKNRDAMLISVFLSILSILLTLATLVQAPSAPFEEAALTDQFFQVNLLLCALLLCVYTSEFMTETLNTQKSLSFHAENDPLTGLRNRYGFAKEVEKLHGTQYCVVMADIDDFKQVNDLYGHSVGDALLSKVGKTLLTSIRKEDAVCRWGGEEFLLVLRCDAETAQATVERIRRKLTAIAVDTGTAAASVTMTFGLADCLEAESFDDLVRIADSNLLRGKRSGKNCLVVTGDSGQELSRPSETQLDTAFLDSPIFSAFSATSDTTYIYMCNLCNNVSRWSRTAVDYFGLPGEYMLDAGSIWMGFIHPEDREFYAKDLDAVLSGRKHFHDVTYRARNRDGEYVRLLCKGVVTEGDADTPALFAGTITNLGVDAPTDGKQR